MTVDRILSRKQPLREGGADDDDALRAAAIGIGEVASRYERDTEGGEETGRHRPELRPRIVFARHVLQAFDGELKAGPEVSRITPRNGAAEGDAIDARHG